VALLPSATVCALGAGGDLVGVSHECGHPAFVRRLPVVTRPKLDVHRDNAAIDSDVWRVEGAEIWAGLPHPEVTVIT
jgi:iron complex transport system substrate-binding protein